MIYDQVTSKALRAMRAGDMQVFMVPIDRTRVKSFANKYGGRYQQQSLVAITRSMHPNNLLVVRCIEPCRPKKRSGRKPNVYTSR